MAKVIWTNFAILELKNIYLYYKLSVSIEIANKIKKSILASTKNMYKKPFSGAIELNLTELGLEHRYLVIGNYKIIYRLIKNDVYITDVFDCRQNPQKMKSVK